MRALSLIALSASVAVCGGCALFQRSTPSQPPAPKASIAPVTEVVHGAADPDYQLGRYYQGRNLDDEAIAAYRRALVANPANAEAHNGLGVVYARQRRYAEAEAEFKAALSLQPRAAHLFNNLGYCYLLQERRGEAVEQFRKAQAIEPDNHRLAENIRLAEGGRESVADKSALPAARSPGLVAVAPNVYELPALPQAPLTIAPATVEGLQGLEVANGNGVTGMARRTARYLAEHRVARQTRITNQKPYTQPLTEIQYRPDHERQARALNALLAQPARLVIAEHLRPTVAVRVVLGRDLARRPVFASEIDVPGTPAPAMAPTMARAD